jgi:hypothetical protein
VPCGAELVSPVGVEAGTLSPNSAVVVGVFRSAAAGVSPNSAAAVPSPNSAAVVSPLVAVVSVSVFGC